MCGMSGMCGMFNMLLCVWRSGMFAVCMVGISGSCGVFSVICGLVLFVWFGMCCICGMFSVCGMFNIVLCLLCL